MRMSSRSRSTASSTSRAATPIVWDKRRIYDVDGMSCRLDGVYGSTGHVKVDLSEIAARRRGWRPNHDDRPRT